MNSLSRWLLLFLLAVCQPLRADDPSIRVQLDTSEVPHLDDWGQEAKQLIMRWHPRIENLLPTRNVKAVDRVKLRLKKSDKGVGATSGSTITISSHWIEKHPEDLGLVFHELVHVVQGYPSGKPWWITEGIADYLRWAIYEGKDLSWFPLTNEPQGYKKGYRITAGFFLWLETDVSPGIVKRINTAMRNGTFSEQLFQDETERSLDELWNEYVRFKKQ
ncbi:MAG: basic secretory protein-like protein [Planctomycetota bacterium]